MWCVNSKRCFIFLTVLNNSSQNGIFPETWKSFVKTPFRKVAKTKKCEVFRTIDTVPVYKTSKEHLKSIIKMYFSINWKQMILFNQIHCVRLGNVVSVDTPVLYGVPQGTALGPVLSIVYKQYC